MTKAQSRIAGLGFFTLAAMLSTEISAQNLPCVPNLGLALGFLEKEQHEFAIGSGINQNGHFTTITIGPDNGQWSMLVTMPNGSVCMVHFGTGWVFALSGERS